ncbi:extracellular solute-binding protein [Hoeflea sp. WL0058]|uniref:Extracellular solute-binding protein n=1 Tax=Flavimaribacter sediminis TaxID=2865987 RepID=A0AAE2ZN34_9HYPH|nr:extracellular solute-binding protein [Flavimaribacter sediminis]MBW8639949.1 extracellular solute-binding protein [Flavimaribacter sediminis]
MFKNGIIAKTALVAVALMTTSAQAQETVVWWDFLAGGDGVRMKQMISDFNAAHEGQISIDATTLEWGVPFYAKVQTSVAVGEAPDIMTYHASRIPLAVKQGLLQEITPADWKKMGLSKDDYADATWNAVTIDDKQYAVPIDTHPIVLYYNKDVLGEAGLLTEDGTPKGMGSREDFTAMLQALKETGAVKFPLGSVTADGNFMFRTIYSLMGQQDGELMTDGEFLAGDNKKKLENALATLAEWTNEGLQSTYTDYPATVALFTTGDAAMMINGVWEVPTMVDLHKEGKLFEWGAVELPVIFDHPATYADSHAFAIPANKGKEMSAEKRDAVLEVMSWISKNSLFWATAGHIPAYGPVTASDAYKTMEPNATYSSLTENMIFDPKTPLAGIAGPIFDVMSTYFVPTLNGEMEPAKAVDEIQYELNDMQ